MSRERNYGIDLLRLVLMYMICILHTLGQGGILKMLNLGTIEYKGYWLLEVLCYCTVDGFAIISGYMAQDKPKKYAKLVDMWFQVFFYSFIVTVVLAVLGLVPEMAKLEFLKSALPVTFGRYWYFTGFFLMFLAAPLFDRFLFALEEKTARRVLIGIVVLFSGLGIIADPFLSHEGNSALWILVLYCVGVLAKRVKLFETRKTYVLIIVWAICMLLTWIPQGFFAIHRLANYHSPTILLSGMIMVILFSRIKIKGTIVSKLSPLAFGVYLLHCNQAFWYEIFEDSLSFVASKNLIIGILIVLGFAFCLFAAGLLVEFLRSLVAKVIRLHKLSEKIVSLCDFLLRKLSVLLK